MVSICLVAMVTSKAMLPYRVIGPSTFKGPSPKLILSMGINVKLSINDKLYSVIKHG